MGWGTEWIAQYGYGALFVLLMLGVVGLPVPDETLLLFVGYLSVKGELNLGLVIATAFLGSACGITASYTIGRCLRPRTVSRFTSFLHIRSEHLDLAYRWVGRWGTYVLLIAYFVPGVRHLAALIVGTSKLPYLAFARFAYTGALVWSGVFIGLGYVAGENWQYLSPLLHRTLVIGAGLAILVIVIVLLIFRRHGQSL